MRAIKRKPDVEKVRAWRVSLRRTRDAFYLGTLKATDEHAAEAAAVREYFQDDDQRRRLVVTEER
jgi:hypothetical protein